MSFFAFFVDFAFFFFLFCKLVRLENQTFQRQMENTVIHYIETLFLPGVLRLLWNGAAAMHAATVLLFVWLPAWTESAT